MNAINSCHDNESFEYSRMNITWSESNTLIHHWVLFSNNLFRIIESILTNEIV